jgi:hypothetical protein
MEPEEKRRLVVDWRIYQDGCEGVDWIELARNRVRG